MDESNQILTIRELIVSRFPLANLEGYFSFLALCGGTGNYDHHIAPRCEFPELHDDARNIVKLTHENHAHAHRLLSDAIPDHQGFRIAALYMSQRSGEMVSEIQSRAGKKGGRSAVDSGQLAKARQIGQPNATRAALLVHKASGWANCKKALMVANANRKVRAERRKLAESLNPFSRDGSRKGNRGKHPNSRNHPNRFNLGLAVLQDRNLKVKMTHNRWHRNRRLSPDCILCMQAGQPQG